MTPEQKQKLKNKAYAEYHKIDNIALAKYKKIEQLAYAKYEKRLKEIEEME